MSRRLHFTAPLPGIPGSTDYELDAVDSATGLYALRSPEGARLFVLSAEQRLPAYRPLISDEQATGLALSTGADAEVFTIVNPAADPTSVNLLAPIVVNRSTGSAAQLILEGQAWPHDAPLGALLQEAGSPDAEPMASSPAPESQ